MLFICMQFLFEMCKIFSFTEFNNFMYSVAFWWKILIINADILEMQGINTCIHVCYFALATAITNILLISFC